MLRFARFLTFVESKKPAKSQYPVKVNCLAVTPSKKAIRPTKRRFWLRQNPFHLPFLMPGSTCYRLDILTSRLLNAYGYCYFVSFGFAKFHKKQHDGQAGWLDG
jgi:hypothetical protein